MRLLYIELTSTMIDTTIYVILQITSTLLPFRYSIIHPSPNHQSTGSHLQCIDPEIHRSIDRSIDPPATYSHCSNTIRVSYLLRSFVHSNRLHCLYINTNYRIQIHIRTISYRCCNSDHCIPRRIRIRNR